MSATLQRPSSAFFSEDTVPSNNLEFLLICGITVSVELVDSDLAIELLVGFL